MDVRFCVLGSGSQGNAALLLAGPTHILIDIGFEPGELAARMEGTGASWETLAAVVLTHTHGDHLKKRCLKEIAARGIPFHAHARHLEDLAAGRYFKRLAEAGRVRAYAADRPIEWPGVRLLPLLVPHDCPPTFGFHIEAANGDGHVRRVGYLADLGHCPDELLGRVRDVDLLALEFNHDEHLERASGRHPHLVARVLGDHGHLSNRQAAEAFARVVALSGNSGPQRLVQMHLSQDCNRPELAFRAASDVVQRLGTRTGIFSTRQERRGTVHVLE